MRLSLRGLDRVVLGALLCFGYACGDVGDSPNPRRSTRSDDISAAGEGASGTNDGTSNNAAPAAGTGTVASRHPGDVGIDTDPAVVFAENFEAPDVATIQSHFNSTTYLLNGDLMHQSADVPAKSSGKKSFTMDTLDGRQSTAIYKLLKDDYEELYLRFYVKYPAGKRWHHTGVWFGGYAPRIPYASPHAGEQPTGDDRFSISFEPMDTVPGAYPNPRLDLYMYWKNMKAGGDNMFWGNITINKKNIQTDDDQWMCIEEHIKVNSDLASRTGAQLDVWKNDELVQHFDDSSPKGYLVGGFFCPEGSDSATCVTYKPQNPTLAPLDLRWRTTENLKINYIWPQNDTIGASTLYFDDIVVATSRIGCLVK